MSAADRPSAHHSTPQSIPGGGLRLCESALSPTETAVEILREARARALAIYGPCFASSVAVIAGMARREVETSSLAWPQKKRVLEALMAMVGPSSLAAPESQGFSGQGRSSA